MLKVVVADDEARVCQLILMLADWDSLEMEVAGVASNGLEALELVERLRPDILITDIRMPGCHGLELIERAKAEFPQLEIVIVSGYAHFEFAQTAIKHGVGDYLLKPIKREELMSTLEKLGRRCRQRSQSASEVERLRQTNQENEDQLRQRLPLDILNQRLETVTEESLWETYRFQAKPGIYQIALLKLDDPSGSFSPATMGIIQDKTATIFQHELDSVCKGPLMAFQAGWGCCLLSFAAENQDAVRKHLRSFLDQLLAQRSVFGAVEFSLALGPAVPRIGELPASAQAARRIAANRLTEGTGRLLEGIPKSSGLDRDRVLDQYRRHMERGMEGLDAQLLDEAVEELIRVSRAVPHIQGWELLELTAAAGRMFLLRPEIEGRERLGQEFEAACDCCGQKSELFQCLRHLQREQLEAVCQRRHNDAIRPIRMAKQYIQQHYSQPITLEDVSEAVGFSSSYFSALFKKETGEGFAKYLTRVRMERAKELLQQTGLPVSEICTQVGYSDLKHFTQNFKKETNLNPGQYRKLYG